MIISKYKVVQIQERIDTHSWEENGLTTARIMQDCYRPLSLVFSSIEDAEHYRTTRDFPEDCMIIQYW